MEWKEVDLGQSPEIHPILITSVQGLSEVG